jgi:Zn-dependent M28 family amino/carboxypeptidase
MRWLATLVAIAACHHAAPVQDTPDAAPPDAGLDRWKQVYDEVDAARLEQLVRDTAQQRYDDAGRQRFRDYWTQYMTALGLAVTPLDYQATGHPRAGVDLEAVLPGASADSVVVIVHYDSIGPAGSETANPAADDDMTGMAIEMETARIFVAHASELAYTVRFVAADEEELGGLGGARAYASHIKAKAQAEGWKLIAAVDDEQTGWNCHDVGQCGDSAWPAFDVYSCGGETSVLYNYPALGDQLASIARAYSPLQVARDCIGPNSDHYAMWEIGVPAVVFTEHNAFGNPHFDQNGNDTVALIDFAYLASIARPAIAFQAAIAGMPQH